MTRITESTGIPALDEANVINEAMALLKADHGLLAEQLQDVARMLAYEDHGWDLLIGVNEDDGATLDEIKRASEKIRELIVGNPIVKRGAQLRASYVWSKGINLGTLTGPSKGRGINVQARIANATNQRYVFSATAHEEMERCAYSDGTVFLLGDNGSREIRRIGIKEITADLRNPDFNEEIWAYQRSWTEYDEKGNKLPKAKQRWYYSDQYTGPRATTIGDIPVDGNSTILDQSFNRQVGWAWGIPDAVSIVAYARLYREFLSHGTIMSKALAQFAFKTISKSPAGVTNTSAKIAAPGVRPGSTANMTDGMDLAPLASAGKGYDFDSGRPLAAQVATGIEVSLIHLLSDPGAAGSSYGSAATLDMPTKRAIVSRQEAWKNFYNRILTWLGQKDADVKFPELDDADPLDQLEALVLGFQQGGMDWDEFRPRLFELLEVPMLHTTPPEGALLPQNEKSLPLKSIDKDALGAAPTPAPSTGVSPRQGRSNGVGGDTARRNRGRTDTIS